MKKLLTLLLVTIMMFTLFAACAEKEPAGDDVSNAPSSDPGQNVSDGGNEVDPDELEEIEYWLVLYGASTTDNEEIYAAINEITEREIGVRVNFTTIAMGDYGTQLTLAIANQQTIDVCSITPVPNASFTTLYSLNALMDITDLIAQYGQGIESELTYEILATTSVDGKIYALPNYLVYNPNAYILYRKDVLSNAGVLEKAENMTTWAEFEEVMEAVKENSSMYAFGGQADVFYNIMWSTDVIADTYMYDTLGDSTNMIWTDQQGNVELFYNRPEAVEMYKMIASWNQKGYYYPDSVISAEALDVSIAQNVYAGAFNVSNYGVETTKSQSIGTEMLCYKAAVGTIATGSGRAWGSGIPSTSANPEAAMKFLNLMYTNADLMNLLVWGIEGKHYTVNENGEAAYLEGKDASTAGYHTYDYAYGNQFLCLPWEGQGGTFREDAKADVAAAIRSIYCGLSFDTSDHSSLIAAIGSVYSEYYNQIAHGLYTDKLYNEFLVKLDSAGVQDYIALYQDAVSEFLK